MEQTLVQDAVTEVNSEEQGCRAMATIQEIASIFPIEGADAIEGVQILGWYCVAKKGEFQVGDKCVFFEIDSILPEADQFEFMRPRKFRVKTAKFRKQISQGLALRIEDALVGFGRLTEDLKGDIFLPNNVPGQVIELQVDADLTQALGVGKHDPEGESLSINAKRELQPSFKHRYWIVRQYKKYSYFLKRWFYKSSLAKALNIRNPFEVKGFPSYVPKTDETRVQNLGKYLRDNAGQPGYTSEKCEGQSITVSRKGKEEFVCSRNLDMSHAPESNWMLMDTKYSLRNKLRVADRDYAIQAEIIGPGVQGNIYDLKELEIRVFYIYDIAAKRKLNSRDFLALCDEWELPVVPILEINYKLPGTVDELVEYSVGKSKLNYRKDREGIVFVAHNPNYDFPGFSCKAINPQYLLKQDKD